MWIKVSFLFLFAHVTFALPAKLLRVPKIYNALITSKEKILPSEAYPASTGPIFQPIGLAGEPIILPPGLLINKPIGVEQPTDSKESGGAARKGKPPAPLTFYPRYRVYYAHQPYLTLQQPILYMAYEIPGPSPKSETQQLIPKELEIEERKDLSLQHSKMKAAMAPTTLEYFKNNRPADRNIPDIPPPPPPVRFKNFDDETA